MPGHLLIVGCGYTGSRLAHLAGERQFAVTGLVRTPATAARVAASGVRIASFDLESGALPPLQDTRNACVVYLVPPGAHVSTDPALTGTLSALDNHGLPRRFVYAGTTGVYGDCGGAWITESRPPAPATDRARRRLAAERLAADWAHARGVECIILRVAAIYGPGRLPLERLRRGEPAIHPAECAFSNRIHVDDLAATCLAVAQAPAPSGLYNVADGHPSTFTDYLLRVAEVAGFPPLRLIGQMEAEKEIGAGMLTFLSESKRIDNRRMLQELGIRLRYPSLKQGISASYAAMQD